jgi:NADH-quinone oxidoreductase subunit N
MIVLSALTMLVGNAMAIIQNNLKRMLAYSSIAHAGYVLVGFAAGTNAARAAIVFYLFVYVFMNLGAFGVLIALTRDGRERENVDDLNGLASQRPGLAAAMTLFLIALAGIPGTAGFVGKFTLFSAAVGAGLMPLAILGVLTSVVSVYFYLRIPVAMYMREPAAGSVDDGENRDSAEVGVIIVCAVAVLLFGLLPDSLFRLLSFAKEAVAAIN